MMQLNIIQHLVLGLLTLCSARAACQAGSISTLRLDVVSSDVNISRINEELYPHESLAIYKVCGTDFKVRLAAQTSIRAGNNVVRLTCAIKGDPEVWSAKTFVVRNEAPWITPDGQAFQVQCNETTRQGDFSVKIPKGWGYLPIAPSMHQMYSFSANHLNGGRPSNLTKGPATFTVQRFISNEAAEPTKPHFALLRLDQNWDGDKSESVASIYSWGAYKGVLPAESVTMQLREKNGKFSLISDRDGSFATTSWDKPGDCVSTGRIGARMRVKGPMHLRLGEEVVFPAKKSVWGHIYMDGDRIREEQVDQDISWVCSTGVSWEFDVWNRNLAQIADQWPEKYEKGKGMEWERGTLPMGENDMFTMRCHLKGEIIKDLDIQLLHVHPYWRVENMDEEDIKGLMIECFEGPRPQYRVVTKRSRRVGVDAGLE